MARITWRGGGGSGNGWAPSARNASSRLTARSVTAANVLATPTSAKLATLAALVGSGALRVPIQAAYTLDQLGEAIAAFRPGPGARSPFASGSGAGDDRRPVPIGWALRRTKHPGTASDWPTWPDFGRFPGQMRVRWDIWQRNRSGVVARAPQCPPGGNPAPGHPEAQDILKPRTS